MAAPSLRPVQYINDSIFDVVDSALQLLGDTTWVADGAFMFLPASDILIVMADDEVGMAYSDGAESAVRLVDGVPLTRSGWFGHVVDANQSGSRIMTSDGSVWSVDDYDQYDTGWWLPPYPIIVTSDELYLINVNTGSKIWVRHLPLGADGRARSRRSRRRV